jgi:hypothetical protein
MKDIVGKNLALGISEGFGEEMKIVSRDMKNAVPTDFNTNINPTKETLDISSLKENSFAGNNSDFLISAFREALTGMAFKVDGEKIGELVVNTVEKVVYS